MGDKRRQVGQSYGLRVVANRVFVEDVFSTLESCSSDVVRDQCDFGSGCVGIHYARINIYGKRVLIRH